MTAAGPRLPDAPGRTQDPPTFDTTTPHSARVWNHWLGGKDNFPVDRDFGNRVLEVFPEITAIARASRAFLGRAVRHLAGEVGIRQFLDVGAGLPTADNTHEIAQRIAPESKIVYVDNDPMVLCHARALLISTPEGTTAHVDADAREPEKILAAAAQTLDLTRPVALLLLGVLGDIPDPDEATHTVDTLVSALPPGSYLAAGEVTPSGEGAVAAYRKEYGHPPLTPSRVQSLFDGLDLVEPGVVPCPLWRPDPGETPTPLDVHCGVARTPEATQP